MTTTARSLVYLVDDDADVRDSLRAVLEPNSAEWQFIGLDSAERFLASFRYTRGVAQCILLDVALPGMDGFALQKELRQRKIAIPVIILTGLSDVPLAVEALQSGAIDVIQKPAPAGRLVSAIQTALEKDRDNQRRQAEYDDIVARSQSLSRRQREVMEAMLNGRLVREMDADMHIGTQTVLKHRASVLKKMQVRSELELSQLLQSLDLLGREEDLPADSVLHDRD